MKRDSLARLRRSARRLRASRLQLRGISRSRRGLAGGALVLVAAAALMAGLSVSASSAGTVRHSVRHWYLSNSDGLGIEPGKIKHVWLIILENKAYDATFTGLNNNTYLWKTLPAQGALLTNYYGTGHSSLDNYVSLAGGQAPEVDDQDDCPSYTAFAGSVDTTGSLSTNPNYGQFTSAAGANAAPGTNGCVYPASVPTLFNQLDAAGVSWKGYAQDLDNPETPSTAAPHSAGVQYCGAPDAAVGPTDASSTTYPNPSSADATDQYVAKHFPFPWFESVLQSGDCNAAHIANLFSPTDGLYHDLQNAATTPAFSWITPDNCSDGHDAVCHGNNLSGGFSDPNTPNPPLNYTGGLYSADLFLEHVVPEIEASPAFKDGGLIDITFDEAYPPFTFSSDSLTNSKDEAPDAATSIADDSAGETLFGKSVNWEPTGPNTPLAKDSAGDELYPGPGYNEYIDRPSTCIAQTVPSQPASQCLLGAAGTVPGARTDLGATATAGSPTIIDPAIIATDEGRAVTGTGIPAGAYVGQVTDTPTVPAQSTDPGEVGFFTLVNAQGQALDTTAAVSGVTLGARTPATDPLYDATDATTGGGDTGSVLISQYVKPGTVSNVYYNHYSWLRTMEDLFEVAKASPGLDGEGHIGYAAQPGLVPFGPDVFTNPAGYP
jgi:hypothetical protein